MCKNHQEEKKCCKQCGKELVKREKELNCVFKKREFCDRSCVASWGNSKRNEREINLKKYNDNPNYCLFCQKEILCENKNKINEIKVKKFCNQSCAAKYNNKLKFDIDYKTIENVYNENPKLCITCNKPIPFYKSKKQTLDRVYCSIECRNSIVRFSAEDVTKENYFNKRKNWQSARSNIRAHAQKLYLKSDKPKCCIVCGYDKHYQVSHIKAVSEFSGDSTIKEINDINNLIALCPNHHWEFDHDENFKNELMKKLNLIKD